MKKQRLKKIIDLSKTKKVAVVGDLMLDVYIRGSASRISQEAPVPIVQVQKRTFSLGGSSNVMHNIVSLGGRVEAYGTVGRDENGKTILSLLGKDSIGCESVIVDSSRKTTEKQRVLAGSQQLLRIDYETVDEIKNEIREKIVCNILSSIRHDKVDAVILEDYAKGLINNEMAVTIIEAARKKGIPAALDPHPSRILEVKGLTLATPNRTEAFALSGTYFTPTFRPVEKDGNLIGVAEKLMAKWEPEYLLVTLGSDGMALFRKNHKMVAIPTRAREVFDVSGAGDTVIAAFMLALLGGADAVEAAEIANHAAGIVVAKIGTASATVEELFQSFFGENSK